MPSFGPKLMYHGGPSFQGALRMPQHYGHTRKQGMVLGPGVYFTSDPKEAGNLYGGEGQIFPALIKLRHYIKVNTRTSKKVLKTLFKRASADDRYTIALDFGYEKPTEQAMSRIIEQYYDSHYYGLNAYLSLVSDLYHDDYEGWREGMFSAGIDGVVAKQPKRGFHVVVFNKSAITSLYTLKPLVNPPSNIEHQITSIINKYHNSLENHILSNSDEIAIPLYLIKDKIKVGDPVFGSDTEVRDYSKNVPIGSVLVGSMHTHMNETPVASSWDEEEGQNIANITGFVHYQYIVGIDDSGNVIGELHCYEPDRKYS